MAVLTRRSRAAALACTCLLAGSATAFAADDQPSEFWKGLRDGGRTVVDELKERARPRWEPPRPAGQDRQGGEHGMEGDAPPPGTTERWAPPEVSAPRFSRIAIEPKGATEISGVGTPGSRVLLKADGVVVGAALVAASGRWQARLDAPLAPGVHRIESAARDGGRDQVVVGSDVRIAIPAGRTGEVVVGYNGEQRDPVRDRAEALARDAGEAFPEVMSKPGDGRAKPARRDQPDRIAQQAEPDSNPVVRWLERSAKEYQGTVIRKLSKDEPGGPGDSTSETKTAKPARPDPTAQDQEPGTSPVDDAARIGEPADGWITRARRSYQEEVARRLAVPPPPQDGATAGREGSDRQAATEAADAAEEQRRREADRLRKEKEAEEARRVAEAQRQREEAERQAREDESRRAEAERKAAEARREAEARRLADDEAARREAEAKRQSEEAQRLAEEQRRRDEEAQKQADAKRRQQEADLEAAERKQAERQETETAKRDAAEARKQADAQWREQEAKRKEEQERRFAEANRKLEEKRVADEARRKEAEERKVAARKAAEEAAAKEERKRVAEAARRQEAEKKAAADRARREEDAKRRAEQLAGRKTTDQPADSAGSARKPGREDDGRGQSVAQADRANGEAARSRKPRDPRPVEGSADGDDTEPHEAGAFSPEPRSCRGPRLTRVKGGRMYQVQPGDSLWSIARRFYGSGARFETIYQANRERISDPGIIIDCQRIFIPKRRRLAEVEEAAADVPGTEARSGQGAL